MVGLCRDSGKLERALLSSRYRKAKDDICYWITDEWYSFESPMQKEIESAYQTALKKNDDMAIALALSPFARKTAELVNSGAYEAAAGSCYAIFRCLAKTCKEHTSTIADGDCQRIS